MPGGSGLVFSLTSTRKPASTSVDSASAESMPSTSGTSTVVADSVGLGDGAPLETTRSTAVPVLDLLAVGRVLADHLVDVVRRARLARDVADREPERDELGDGVGHATMPVRSGTSTIGDPLLTQ